MSNSKKYGMNTKAIHTEKRVKLPTGDVMPPIHLSTTFENSQPGEYEYFYGRSGNPTRELFERTLASLEGVEDFESMHSFGMASGMAAVTLIGELVEPGENVVITRDVYGGTTRFFSQVMTKRGIEVNFCDLYDEDNTRHIAKSYTISSADTWEKKTLTFAGDTSGALNNDNGSSLTLDFWLAAGSNYTSGTLSTSWSSVTTANRAVGQVNLADSTSNEWYITGVQLEAGTSASDFEFLPYDVNLGRCQRYYFKINSDNTFGAIGSGVYNSTTQCRVTLNYPKIMRTNVLGLEKSGNQRD